MTERTAAPAPAIRVLPAVVADQIAAGEVVTRPASVVKELVDNAIDARAERITVEIETGGTALVVVTDDGHGMAEADARLCILRHATSKIRTADELVAIRSLGFRGEALPSIASVSRLRLRTRRAEDAEGTELRLEGGELVHVGPCGCAPGCTVEVRDLFYNVPARRKFMRALSTESAQVTETIVEAALGHHAVTITLVRDGRAARRFPRCSSRLERVADVLGAEEWIRCAGERGPMRIEGFLGRPERARAGATGLRFVVNGRPVTDRLLARAVAAAYGDALDRGRYPIGVVYVELPAELVDVNVHPQKAEVRFAQARAVTDAVHSVVRPEIVRVLGLASAGPGPSGEWIGMGKRAPLGAESDVQPAPWSWSGTGRAAPSAPPAATAPSGPLAPGAEGVARPARLQERWTPPTPPAAPIGALSTTPAAAGPGLGAEPTASPPLPRVLGVLRNGSLAFETADGLVVIDPVAARRVALETALEQQRLPLPSAPLLFPVVRDVAPLLAERVETWAPKLADHGLELRRSGIHAVALLGVPAAADVADAAALLDALVAWLDVRSEHEPPGLALDTDAHWPPGLAALLARQAGAEVTKLGEPRGAVELLQVALGASRRAERCVLATLPWSALELPTGRPK